MRGKFRQKGFKTWLNKQKKKCIYRYVNFQFILVDEANEKNGSEESSRDSSEYDDDESDDEIDVISESNIIHPAPDQALRNPPPIIGRGYSENPTFWVVVDAEDVWYFFRRKLKVIKK